MAVLRTVSRSLTASRPTVRGSGAYENALAGRSGVELAGLRCTDEEYAVVWATMPESLRPSVYGAWNGSFERAYDDWRTAQAAGEPQPVDDAAPAHEQLSHAAPPLDETLPLTTQVLQALGVAGSEGCGCQSIAAALGRRNDSVNTALSNLVINGRAIRLFPKKRGWWRGQRYVITDKGRAALSEITHA